MLNALYVDYKIDTKSEITPAEQVAINLKKAEVENIEETIQMVEPLWHKSTTKRKS